MIEDIKLDAFSKESGIYLFKANDEVIYVGSSKNLYHRMVSHRRCIKKGSEQGYKQDFYQFLQSNEFTVEFQLTDNYRQLEQEFIEKYHPKYNTNRAYTGLVWNGNKVEYYKQYYESNKEEILGQSKQYYASHEQQKKQYQRIYDNQLCSYNGQTITLCALKMRFIKAGISHPTIEAKKYLIGGNNDQ